MLTESAEILSCLPNSCDDGFIFIPSLHVQSSPKRQKASSSKDEAERASSLSFENQEKFFGSTFGLFFGLR